MKPPFQRNFVPEYQNDKIDAHQKRPYFNQYQPKLYASPNPRFFKEDVLVIRNSIDLVPTQCERSIPLRDVNSVERVTRDSGKAFDKTTNKLPLYPPLSKITATDNERFKVGVDLRETPVTTF